MGFKEKNKDLLNQIIEIKRGKLNKSVENLTGLLKLLRKKIHRKIKHISIHLPQLQQNT